MFSLAIWHSVERAIREIELQIPQNYLKKRTIRQTVEINHR